MPAGGGVNCWLMFGVTGATGATDRVLGDANSAFTAANTQIAFNTGGVAGAWAPGAVDAGNLNGTWEALDCYSDPMQCVYEDYPTRIQPGGLSRSGWYLLDDTWAARLEDDGGAFGVPWHNDSVVDGADLYFFAFGGDYRAQLKALSGLSGAIAMPPAAALGVWWSRYYPYSQAQFVSEVLQGYADNGLPLNTVVLDMDWCAARVLHRVLCSL